ncbi:hypothetical protein CO174_03435 [Candidatus Uhrbacteria bacterium CG_4_9_14_3_um_filter_50_9]|uniref:Uncharacterized protein n=1 Tax=Candidatus Uhrbacteria bacterium CG_4_9_14_3_um_filter_50_9 TaxID=1975035 RepID=A0A2M7XC12_9BACT|nr:MAG: hypothetical protein CO174_03435 [Candidatus Uhrbacteria bacterium CG_4_9_14_3_um_filter_50_9]
MEENDQIQIQEDPLLKGKSGIPVSFSEDSQDSPTANKYPASFLKINRRIFKVVGMYAQLLWEESPNGKTIAVSDLLENAKYLFGSRYQSQNKYVQRHIAVDLREITAFLGFKSQLRRKSARNMESCTTSPSILCEVVHLNLL